MKLAGVSIKKDNLISKDELIALALKTKDYAEKRNALELINKEIKESGLYRENKIKSTKPKAKSKSSNRSVNNTEQK